MNRIEVKSGEFQRMDVACEFKLASDDPQEGAIDGYASVFNLMDRGGDIVLPKAFKASLADWRKRKEAPPMLWHHDPSKPVGVWTDLQEDEKGLRVSGELILDIPDGSAARALLKHGAVKGLSIGYRARDYEIDRMTGARRLKQVELFEISLVTIPMLREAQITSVKSEFDAPGWERAFRDEGLSNREAKIATSVARKMASRDGEPFRTDGGRDGVTDVLLNLRRLSAQVRAG